MGLPGGLLKPPWAFWGPLEASWGLLWPSVAFRRPPGASWRLLGPPCGLLEPSGCFLADPQKLTNIFGFLLDLAQNPIFYGIPWPLLFSA